VMEHDLRFKTLIREFFADFLRLFFADWAAKFDLERVEWLDKEVQSDPPDDSLHILDLVAKVPARESPAAEPTLVVVHIEIESADRTTRIEPRLPDYYYRLRSTHQLPILPIVIYLEVGLDGIGIRTVADSVLGFTVATINYLYVGLPALDAVQYLEGENYLGVALTALMKVPKERIRWLGREANRRIRESPLSEKRRLLLLKCLNEYLPWDEETRDDYESLVRDDKSGEVQVVKNIIVREAEERGEARGIAKGEHLGQVGLLTALLERKFGPLPSAVAMRLENLPPARVREIALTYAGASSLADLGLGE
jgi:hypothetical protein